MRTAEETAVHTDAAPAAGTRSAADHRSRLLAAGLLAAVVLGGIALRAWVVSSNLGTVDSDEAVGGLIARHMADGRFYVFLWGNAYGGTLEAILTAPLFAVFGSGAVLMKAVAIAMYAGACVLTWRIGRRTIGPRAALLAGALLWLGPAPLVLISTKARMYYGAALVLTCAAVLLSLRLREARSRRDMAVLGLVVGLGLWAAPFVFYVLVPILAWLVASRPRRLVDVPYAIPAAVLGAAPWLAFNVRNGWPSLHEKPIPVDTSYGERLEEFFTELIPRLLNLKTYWGEWVFGGAGRIVYIALLAALAGLAGWCLLRPEGRRSRLVPLVVILAGYPFLFAIPTASFYVDEPRYGLFLAPVLALLAAAGVIRLLSRTALQVAAVALFGVLSAAGVAALVNFGDRYPGHHDLSPVPTDELVDALEHRGITTLRADYWIAYALTFESEERIIATPVATVRFEPYEERFRESGSTAYVFFPESPEEQHFVKEVVSKGSGWRREPIGDDFVLYTGGHATP